MTNIEHEEERRDMSGLYEVDGMNFPSGGILRRKGERREGGGKERREPREGKRE